MGNAVEYVLANVVNSAAGNAVVVHAEGYVVALVAEVVDDEFVAAIGAAVVEDTAAVDGVFVSVDEWVVPLADFVPVLLLYKKIRKGLRSIFGQPVGRK